MQIWFLILDFDTDSKLSLGRLFQMCSKKKLISTFATILYMSLKSFVNIKIYLILLNFILLSENKKQKAYFRHKVLVDLYNFHQMLYALNN